MYRYLTGCKKNLYVTRTEETLPKFREIFYIRNFYTWYIKNIETLGMEIETPFDLSHGVIHVGYLIDDVVHKLYSSMNDVFFRFCWF